MVNAAGGDFFKIKVTRIVKEVAPDLKPHLFSPSEQPSFAESTGLDIRVS